jgi:membrane protein
MGAVDETSRPPFLRKAARLSFRTLARRVWRDIDEDDVLGNSAKLSYYFLLALFPLLIFVSALLGLARTGAQIVDHLLEYSRPVLPSGAWKLVVDTLAQIRAGAGSGKLSFGLIAALWAASSGMSAVMNGLNRAYGVTEARPWWKSQIVSVILTIALAVFIVSALLLVLAGDFIGDFLAGRLGLESFFHSAWAIVQWPLVLGFVLLAFTLLYRFAPDLHGLQWLHTIPGAIVAVVLWLLISLLFKVYLHFFNSYGATYGSLGAVIILMLWLYLTGAAILIGGTVNSEIENAEAEAGEPETRLTGEKVPGEKGSHRLRPRPKGSG